MSEALLFVSFASIASLIVLSAAAFSSERFQFFPPPSRSSWQYRVFWLLFRVMFITLVLLSVIEFNAHALWSPWLRYGLWLPLLLLGFGGATYLSAKLGWKNAHGEKEGLVVSGVYRWSRNPIYVASLVGMLGWALFVNALYVYYVLSLWAFLYILAPFVEEPWLERVYGEAFLKYKQSTPRFLGIPKSRP